MVWGDLMSANGHIKLTMNTEGHQSYAIRNEVGRDGILSPTFRDVISGRGQGVQRHPGNVKYREMVRANKVRMPVSMKCHVSDL